MTIHYLVNDLSMCGQFKDAAGFRDAIDRIMTIRNEITRYGVSLYCHRKLAQAAVFPDMLMPQAIGCLPIDQRRALMQWLTAKGPYWEDDQVHSSDEWYDVNGNVVTDTGLAEAAACLTRSSNRELVSFDPSPWLHTPIPVKWESQEEPISVLNHWLVGTVQASLKANAPVILNSWSDLETYALKQFGGLSFGEKAFRPLDGHPFVPGACERIVYLLNVLDKFKSCFDDNGDRTKEGDELHAQHFAGGKALFTDSSEKEKNAFNNELTFPHPDGDGYLFCTWHGKVKTPQIRIHFTYPILKDQPLYVMYVGPKITKF